ncbi:hypothetical protein RINTHH_16520 [Richelia intracellularis HH01]|uniref:Uncharacterized protein n=1 Tax=Richelia intracellularis HH01 TaxID=1165094 RepID=M1WZR0_9NOST|nr:hypothetical protein RINTHH_16520 [Richelia intracellularis HH01]
MIPNSPKDPQYLETQKIIVMVKCKLMGISFQVKQGKKMFIKKVLLLLILRSS